MLESHITGCGHLAAPSQHQPHAQPPPAASGAAPSASAPAEAPDRGRWRVRRAAVEGGAGRRVHVRRRAAVGGGGCGEERDRPHRIAAADPHRHGRLHVQRVRGIREESTG